MFRKLHHRADEQLHSFPIISAAYDEVGPRVPVLIQSSGEVMRDQWRA